MQATNRSALLLTVAALNGGVLWLLPQPAAQRAAHMAANAGGTHCRTRTNRRPGILVLDGRTLAIAPANMGGVIAV
jgi:hypothetical protein